MDGNGRQSREKTRAENKDGKSESRQTYQGRERGGGADKKGMKVLKKRQPNARSLFSPDSTAFTHCLPFCVKTSPSLSLNPPRRQYIVPFR
jgi:hypothetical protein